MFRPLKKRNNKSLVDARGYVDLSTACKRANETGYFGLSQRVAPESFDGQNTNIDPRECFFGGRRVELALQAQKAEDFATRAVDSVKTSPTGDSTGVNSSE